MELSTPSFCKHLCYLIACIRVWLSTQYTKTIFLYGKSVPLSLHKMHYFKSMSSKLIKNWKRKNWNEIFHLTENWMRFIFLFLCSICLSTGNCKSLFREDVDLFLLHVMITHYPLPITLSISIDLCMYSNETKCFVFRMPSIPQPFHNCLHFNIFFPLFFFFFCHFMRFLLFTLNIGCCASDQTSGIYVRQDVKSKFSLCFE